MSFAGLESNVRCNAQYLLWSVRHYKRTGQYSGRGGYISVTLTKSNKIRKTKLLKSVIAF